jgi:uncharacterized protein YunC (DUF1805 family)
VNPHTGNVDRREPAVYLHCGIVAIDTRTCRGSVSWFLTGIRGLQSTLGGELKDLGEVADNPHSRAGALDLGQRGVERAVLRDALDQEPHEMRRGEANRTAQGWPIEVPARHASGAR